MLNSGTDKEVGFTIIEVMIVLAVSGLIFLIAAVFMSGKIEQTTFSSGVNQMASTIQDTIEQVEDGKYSDLNLQCPESLGGNGVNQAQGTNASCDFVGKLIHFYGSPATSYEVISLAGAQSPLTTQDLSATTGIANLTTQSENPENLKVLDVSINNAHTNSFNLGFIQYQGLDSSTDVEPISLTYDSSITNNGSLDGRESTISGLSDTVSNASICVTDGTRYANILLGIDNNSNTTSPITVSIQQLETTPCT